MKKAVKIIAIIYSILDSIALVILCIALFGGAFWESLLGIAVLVVNLILLWALYNAFERIENLEEYVSKKKDKQSQSEITKTIDTSDKLYNKLKGSGSSENKKTVNVGNKPYKQCKACGAVERTNENRCPMCNTPYEES